MSPRSSDASALSGLRLDELVRELPGVARVTGDAAARVTGVHHDSRAVTPGDLFVARRGTADDGARFVADAIARGARAVLAPRSLDASASPVPVVVVDDVVVAFAYAAAAIYGHPSFSLEVVGVTGTNGKTTVAHLVRAAVDGALGVGPRCGVIGTVGHRYGDLALAAAHTTPEADELARVMAAMRARGATHVAMEVSSHALALGRALAVRFRVAAFTNLTQDHLDFHGSMEEYAAAKARLFTELSPGSAVIHVGDAFGQSLAARVRAPLVRVSAELGADCDIAPLAVTIDENGIDCVLRTPVGKVHLVSRLVGAHNLENLVVALGVAHALELDVRGAAEALAGEPGAPGRLERCDTPEDDVTVLVDYAHTPDALARALDSVRRITRGRILCVFGCGGDRDKAKRAPMGAAAASRSDVAIVTNDNPRTEDPRVIADAILEGVRGHLAPLREGALAAGRGYFVELDRSRAIDLAVHAAAPGDIVLLAGKGHEDYQILGTTKRHLDDREEARRALAARRSARGNGG